MIRGWRCNFFNLWFYFKKINLKKKLVKYPITFQIEKFLYLTRLDANIGNGVGYFIVNGWTQPHPNPLRHHLMHMEKKKKTSINNY